MKTDPYIPLSSLAQTPNNGPIGLSRARAAYGTATGTGTASQQPDYGQALSTDPQLQAALEAVNGQLAAYRAQETAAIQQALENYGSIPASLMGKYGEFINKTVRDLANAATTSGVSTVAQLTKGYHDSRTQAIDALAARGILHSGALGQHENDTLTAYNQSSYNALQALLSNLAGYQSTFLDQQNGLNQQAYGAANDAANRIYAGINNGYYGTSGYTDHTAAQSPSYGPGTPPSPGATARAGVGSGGATNTSATAAPGQYTPLPYKVRANPTGGSYNPTQGIFAVH